MIRIAGYVVWVAVALPVLLQGAESKARLQGWCVAMLLFAIAFGIATSRPHLTRILAAVETGSVIVMVLMLCNGFEGTLLVIVAMQLAGAMPRRQAIGWIVVQTLLLFAAIAIHWSPRPAILLTPPYFGFQLLSFLAFASIAEERAARRELEAVQGLLTDSSRLGERLRIARELHDAIGHHLTALSLNLEAALQKSDGAVREHVQTSQSLARGLLADVREIVAEMSAPVALDLEQALRPIVGGVPKPRIHLQVASDVRVESPECAHILVRCAQEIVTNAARHSGADNLWIVVERDGDAVRIRARDDGKGTSGASEGFGLRTMRQRLESAGGTLEIVTRPGSGFNVVATVPARTA